MTKVDLGKEMVDGMKVQHNVKKHGLVKVEVRRKIRTGSELSFSPIFGIVSSLDVGTVLGIVIHKGNGIEKVSSRCLHDKHQPDTLHAPCLVEKIVLEREEDPTNAQDFLTLEPLNPILNNSCVRSHREHDVQ